MAPGPGWRKCTVYRRPGPGATPLGLASTDLLWYRCRSAQARFEVAKAGHELRPAREVPSIRRAMMHVDQVSLPCRRAAMNVLMRAGLAGSRLGSWTRLARNWAARDCTISENDQRSPRTASLLAGDQFDDGVHRQEPPYSAAQPSDWKRWFGPAGRGLTKSGCAAIQCEYHNVRGEAGPTAWRQAREEDGRPRRFAGLVPRRWASPRPRG